MSRTTISQGSLVYVKYLDHVFFRDADPDQQTPRIMEAWGQLQYENEEYLRVICETYCEPDSLKGSKTRAMGLVILKNAIVELRKVSA